MEISRRIHAGRRDEQRTNGSFLCQTLRVDWVDHSHIYGNRPSFLVLENWSWDVEVGVWPLAYAVDQKSGSILRPRKKHSNYYDRR